MMRKRENLIVSRKIKTSSAGSSTKPLSSTASVNLSGGSSAKAEAAEDPEVEIDIYYSQYLQARFLEKLMAENKANTDDRLKAKYSSLLDPKTELENPKVAALKTQTEELKQLGAEYSKLQELEKELTENFKN